MTIKDVREGLLKDAIKGSLARPQNSKGLMFRHV